MYTGRRPTLSESVGIVGWVLFGLVVGVVAELLMRGRDPGLGEARRAGF